MIEAKPEGLGVSEIMNDLYDQVGKLMRTLSPDGTITGRFEYDAWGNPLLEEPPLESTRFGFSAPAWIKVGDVYVSPARVYVPELGRFLQRDPLGRSPRRSTQT